MDEGSSPTDVSSSLSEFVRRERVFKELYPDTNERCPSREFKPLRYNDEEIDDILKQMGRLLSPAGKESDNQIYKHVIEETENKSIEQILSEAKELINDNSIPLADDALECLSVDDVSSVSSVNDITFINIEDGTDEMDEVNGNYEINNSKPTTLSQGTPKLKNVNVQSSDFLPQKLRNTPPKTESTFRMKVNNIEYKKSLNNKNEEFRKEMQVLRDEIKRVNQLYESSKVESVNLRKEIARLELKWEQREKQLVDENLRLKRSAMSAISQKEFESFQAKIDSANETINCLKSNLNRANEEWKKKETRLILESEQLRHQLKSSPKFAQPDVERLREQLKDSEEMNVKLKLDFESYKEKCLNLENLCTDLKKIIMDEQIAEKLYADDDTPASVKQFLSSSPSSVFNTLTHMFGCLSRSGRNRTYSGQKERSELFTTHESSMINDLTKSHDHHNLIRELLKEKDHLRKENIDLNRQVKELENIVRRRAHPNFSNVSQIIRNDESKRNEEESDIVKNLKRELLDKQHVIMDMKNQIAEMRALSDQNLLSLQAKLVKVQEESMKMKEDQEKNINSKKVTTATTTTSTTGNHAPKCKRKGRSCDPPPHSARNFRVELSAKEREVNALNKQIEELKKTNRKLMKDKENNHLSLKEKSAESIQLNNKFARINRENEKSSAVDKFEITVTKSQPSKQNIDNGSPVQISNNNAAEMVANDVKTPETAVMNSPIDVPQNDCEPKTQNIQQVLCELFKLLAKEESNDKIKNSNNDIQPEEIRRFVAAFKNLSN